MDRDTKIGVAGLSFMVLVILGVLWFALPGFDRVVLTHIPNYFWLSARGLVNIAYVVCMVAAIAMTLSTTDKNQQAAFGVAFVCLAAGLYPLVIQPSNRTHYEARNATAQSITEVVGDRPEFAVRVPYPQAYTILERSLSNIAGNRMASPTYVNGEWCTFVTRDTTLARRWVTNVACVGAGGVPRFAEMDPESVPAPGGRFGSSLYEAATEERSGVLLDNEDVYAYIDNSGDGVLVAPLTEYTGLMARRQVPAGVLVVDHSGAATLFDDVAPGEIPGPVFPMSLAERIRQSVNQRDGFVIGRKPQRNPNALQTTAGSANKSEFVLERVADGRFSFVTPMTPYGSGSNIVAYLEVPSDEVSRGALPEVTLYRLDGRVDSALESIRERVITLYDRDIDWAEGPSDNKSAVFEPTPSSAGVVTATIGVGSQIQYRVVVDAELVDSSRVGEVCIYSVGSDSSVSEGSLIRCDGPYASPAPIGALRGFANGSSDLEGDAGSVPGSVSDLGEFSTLELIEELRRRGIAGEL